MEYPNLKEEKRLWKQGRKIVVGIDEVGRGPLAGPVIACALCICGRRSSAKLAEERLPQTSQVKDSKQLTSKQREEIYKLLKKDSNVKWGIGRVSEKVIDKINILQATKLVMQKAIADLEKKLSSKNRYVVKINDRTNLLHSKKIDYLLIDGNFEIKTDIPQKSIIKGDAKVFSIAAASIIAKVTRDRLMISYAKKYPQYGFDIHKGYSTLLHRQKIKEHGFCPIHRRSFYCD